MSNKEYFLPNIYPVDQKKLLEQIGTVEDKGLVQLLKHIAVCLDEYGTIVLYEEFHPMMLMPPLNTQYDE